MEKQIKFILFIFICICSSFLLFSKDVYAGEITDYDFTFQVEADKDGKISGIDMQGGYKSGDTYLLDNSVGKERAWNILAARYKNLIIGATGLLALVLLGFAMASFLKFSRAGENPQAKKDAIMHFMVLLIAAALMGSATMIFAFAYMTLR